MVTPMSRKAATKRGGWTYINLPKELADKIDKLLDSRTQGYRSRGDFIADAVRRRLDEIRSSR